MANNSYILPGQEEKEREILKGKPKVETFYEDPIQQPSNAVTAQPASDNSDVTEERTVKYSMNYPFAPIVGPEYFEQQKQKEKELLEKRLKREKGRMTAGALADTIRLIGHGTAINRGAYETPWKKNEHVERGSKALEQYRNQYADAIRNIEDAELRNQLAGKEFNYREFLRSKKEKDAEEAEQEAKRRWEEQFGYQKERDKVRDEQWEKKHELDKKRVANSRWYQQRRLENGDDAPEDNQFPFRYRGNEYGIDFSNKYHKAGIAKMANRYLTELEKERDNMSPEAWRKVENSDLYQSVKKLSEKDWPDDFAPISTILPDFFDPNIAQEYNIPYRALPQQTGPVYGPTREDMNMGLDPGLKSDVIRALEKEKQEKEGTYKQTAPQQRSEQPQQQKTDSTSTFPELNPKNLSGKEITDLRPIERNKLLEADWQMFDPRKDQDAMRLKRDVAIDRYMKATESDPGTEDKLTQAAIEMYNYMKYAKPQQLVNQFGNIPPEEAVEILKEVLEESKN